MFLTIISDHKLQLYGKVIERTIEAHLKGPLVMNKDTFPGIQRLGTSVDVVNCLLFAPGEPRDRVDGGSGGVGGGHLFEERIVSLKQKS